MSHPQPQPQPVLSMEPAQGCFPSSHPTNCLFGILKHPCRCGDIVGRILVGGFIDTASCIQIVENTLRKHRVMLRDYFSFEINDDGELVSIPLLLKGYMPSLGKLPAFLLRLGPNVSNLPYCIFIFISGSFF